MKPITLVVYRLDAVRQWLIGSSFDRVCSRCGHHVGIGPASTALIEDHGIELFTLVCDECAGHMPAFPLQHLTDNT